MKEKVTALFPKGITRRVHYNPDTLKAQWVSFYDCVNEMHQGYLEWSSEAERYVFYFNDLDEELRFVRDYKPRRKTYKDCSQHAITVRAAHSRDTNKYGPVWET